MTASTTPDGSTAPGESTTPGAEVETGDRPTPVRHSAVPTGNAGASTPSPAATQRHVRMRQAGVMALATVLTGVMLVLGIWQMSVYRSEGAKVLQQRADQAPVSLDAQLASGTTLGSMYGLQVTLTGHYLAEKQVIVGTAPPYRVLAGFQDGSRIIGVVRGTVTSPTASIPALPTGQVTQSGILLPSEGSGSAGTPTGTSSTMPTVNLEKMAQSWPEGAINGFVTLSASEASAQHLTPATVTMPDNASGRAQNLGYAMQWWVFAIFTMAMGIVISRSMGRRSRKADTSASGAAG